MNNKKATTRKGSHNKEERVRKRFNKEALATRRKRKQERSENNKKEARTTRRKNVKRRYDNED